MARHVHRVLIFVFSALLGACGGSSAPPEEGGAQEGFGFMDVGVKANAVPNAHPRNFCCAGERVYMSWHDDRNGNDRVYFNYSTDGGLTWQAADTRLDSSEGVDSNDVHMCCDGLNICVAWNDRLANGSSIFANASSDGGVTWQTAQTEVSRIPTGVGGDNGAFDVALSCNGQRIYASWLDNRNRSSFQAARDIYFDYSDDGGVTWQKDDQRLNTNPLNTSRPNRPSTCSDGLYVYVVWNDPRDGETDIYLNSSIDGGMSWLEEDKRVDLGDDPGETASFGQTICCNGDRCFVAWEDARNRTDAILGNVSLDAGKSWRANSVSVSQTEVGVTRNPQACCDGNNVCVLWLYSVGGGGFDVFVNRSTQFGENFSEVDVRRINTGSELGFTTEIDDAVICCTGEHVYAAWADTRSDNAAGPDGNKDIYFNWSIDGGDTWSPQDVRVDGGDEPGQFQSEGTKICCDADWIYVAWGDRRDGQDAFVNRTTSPAAPQDTGAP